MTTELTSFHMDDVEGLRTTSRGSIPGSLQRGPMSSMQELPASPTASEGPKVAPRILTRSKSGRLMGHNNQQESLTPSRTASALTNMMRRRVMFCPTPKNSLHEVTPYSKVYGQHPSFFEFDRHGEMQLNDKGIAEEMRRQELGTSNRRRSTDSLAEDP